MAYYLIAAGGTGAKCVNAFVHLVAAGLMPTNDAIQIYFVDADVTNGNRNVTLNSIKYYQEAYNGLNQLGASLGADCPLFRNQIQYGFDDPKHNWNPLPNNNYTLDKILQVGTLPQGYQSLFRVLYPQEKREATFQNGFLGWPSVGSAIISSAYDQLSHLTNAIAADPQAKVLLMGSIFGGTGAASIPTLAKLLAQSFENKTGATPDRQSRSLGLVLMLPYFMFDKGLAGDNPNIEPLNFALKTQSALQYYYSHGLHEICNRIYLLGDSHLNKVAENKQIGGQNQRNRPHYLELYAGLAALDFYGYNPPATTAERRKEPVYQETCRADEKVINWQDLPYGERNWNIPYDYLHALTSTGYIYNASFMPLFRGMLAQNGVAPNQFPWFAHLFDEQRVNLREAWPALNKVYDYFYNYLQWLYEMHTPLAGDANEVRLQLFNRSSLEHYLAEDRQPQQSLEDLSEPDYIHLTYHADPANQPAKSGFMRDAGFKLVRKQMNKYSFDASAQGVRHLGAFFNALYHCSL